MNNFINIMSNDLCSNNFGYKIFSFLGNIFNFIKIFVPIILIIFGIIDLLKGIINDNQNKNIKILVKRFIYGVSIYFLTTIILFILNLVNNDINNDCLKIFLNPKDKTSILIDIDDINDKTTCNNLGAPYIWKDNECRIDISNENILNDK